MLEGPVDRTFLVRLVGAALGLRLFVALLTAVPAEDGVNYLWMAERIAAGDFGAALSDVFPPLWPTVIAGPVAAGLPAFRGAQLAAVLIGALAVWPMARLAARAVPEHARLVAILVAVSPLTVRFAGECYSEPLFLLLAAWATELGLGGRRLAAACVILLAAWTRPEGSAIGAALWLTAPLGHLPALLAAVAAPLLLGAARALTGNGFEVLPKLALHASRPDTPMGAGFEFRPEVLLDNVIALPGAWLEAFQGLGILAAFGLWYGRHDPALRVHRWLLLLGVLAIVTFLTRRRFLVSWLFAVAPFAGVAFARLPAPGRFPVTLLVFLVSFVSSLKLHDRDRIGEQAVGEYLAGQRMPDESVTGDMTRVLYFAGLRPLEPRHFSVDELVAAARRPGVRFVVLGQNRPTAGPVQAALEPEFDTMAMPESVREAAERRGLVVLERRAADEQGARQGR